MPKTIGTIQNLNALTKHHYTQEEIDYFQLRAAVNNHPLSSFPTSMRSKLAYQQIIKAGTTTTRYLLPGQMVVFHYSEPKYKDELEYYDATPFTLFCGITRTKDGNIREIGLNLHYFPPYARLRILEVVYEAFKPFWQKHFNKVNHSPNTLIDYDALRGLLSDRHVRFGLKMYIPVLRGTSYIIPPRLLGTAFFTEGHFSKATKTQVHRFWRRAR